MKGRLAIPKMTAAAVLVFAAAASPEARGGDPGRIVFVAQDRLADNLFAVNADGSGFAQLTHLPPHTFMASPPAWSPDGRYIAFDGGNGAYLLPEATPGTPVLVCPLADSFVWARDSRSIICLAANQRPRARLFAVQVNDLRTHELSDGWPAFPDSIVFSLTADKAVTKLAFVKKNFRYGRAASSEIYTVNPDGSGLADIAPRPASYNDIDNLVFSPDGLRLADCDYERMRSIVTRRTDGTDRRILSSTVFLERQVLSWSPDSKTLAWWDESGIVLSDVITARKSTPAGGRGGRDPAFSPDGGRIAYACDPYNGKMCVMNTDGSGVKPLTQMGRVHVGRPVWRP